MPLKPQLPQGASLASSASISHLCTLLRRHSRILLLSGAGISTESGLSDYRSPGKTTPSRPPINHHEYITYPSIRRRYWARSFTGYSLLSTAQPSLAHHALLALSTHARTPFFAHVTQNVDGLLQRAAETGHVQVRREMNLVELHGSIHGLVCRACNHVEDRAQFQIRLQALNSKWAGQLSRYEFRPDGDADIPNELVPSFQVPSCRSCQADALMPTVVFHGGSVPRVVADTSWKLATECDAVLVVGSSVTPHSAFRLVKEVKKRRGGVYCINFGNTRGDDIYDYKVEGLVGDALARIARAMVGFKHNAGLQTVLEKRDGAVRRLEL